MPPTFEFREMTDIEYKRVLAAFDEHGFDHMLFQITAKDEEKINDIYHQAIYLLKPKGTLLLIGRKDWMVSVSSKFTLEAEELLEGGGNTYKLWLMRKK